MEIGKDEVICMSERKQRLSLSVAGVIWEMVGGKGMDRFWARIGREGEHEAVYSTRSLGTPHMPHHVPGTYPYRVKYTSPPVHNAQGHFCLRY